MVELKARDCVKAALSDMHPTFLTCFLCVHQGTGRCSDVRVDVRGDDRRDTRCDASSHALLVFQGGHRKHVKHHSVLLEAVGLKTFGRYEVQAIAIATSSVRMLFCLEQEATIV